MKRKYYYVIFVVVIIILAVLYNKQISQKNIYTIPEDKESCELEGGVWQKAGRAQGYVCIVSYKDSGKTCKDSSQCFGRCIYRNFDDNRYKNFLQRFRTGDKLRVTGKCEADSSPFKCMTEVKNGFIEQPIACLD